MTCNHSPPPYIFEVGEDVVIKPKGMTLKSKVLERAKRGDENIYRVDWSSFHPCLNIVWLPERSVFAINERH